MLLRKKSFFINDRQNLFVTWPTRESQHWQVRGQVDRKKGRRAHIEKPFIFILIMNGPNKLECVTLHESEMLASDEP
jgi:hypothetical protein